MTKEIRLLFITSLTLFVYALSIFFDEGALLFPFPLNQLIVLIVATQFTLWNFKTHKTASIAMLLIGLFSALGNEFYWAVILNNEKMTLFSRTIATDIFQLLSGTATIALGIYFGKKQNRGLTYIFLGVFCFTFSAGLVTFTPLLSSLFLSFSYLTMAISVRITPVFKPIQIFWILLFVLEFSKLLSILLNN